MTSYIAKVHQVNCNALKLGGIYGINNIDITHTDPTKQITVNGIVPGAGGGGGSLPITGNGDITMTTGNIDVQAGDIQAAGNITATGDGITTGKVEGVYLRSSNNILAVSTITGNLLASETNITLPDTNTIIRKGTGASIGTETEYCISQGTAFRTVANTFTNLNTFQENVVMSGTGKEFQNLGGSVHSATANITGGIQCGSVNCGNVVDNSIKTKNLNFRTSGLNGWDISQDVPTVVVPPAVPPPTDNLLRFEATQPGGFAAFLSSEFDPLTDSPNILINPATVGYGQISANIFTVGTDSDNFSVYQPHTGADNVNMLIQSPSITGVIKFKTNTATDIATVQNAGLKIAVDKTFSFGSYNVTQQQYTYTFTGAVIDDNPATLFNNSSTVFTNTNTGTTSTYFSTAASEGNYMLTITGDASSGGTVGKFRYSVPFPWVMPAFSTGTVYNNTTGSFRGSDFPSGMSTPQLCSYSLGGSDFKLCWPSFAAGTETYGGVVTITKMPW